MGYGKSHTNLHVVTNDPAYDPFRWSTTTTTLPENSLANPVPSVKQAVDQYRRTALEAQLRIEQAVRDTDQAIARAVEDIERALLEAEIAGIALDEDLSEQVAEIIRDNSIDGDDL